MTGFDYNSNMTPENVRAAASTAAEAVRFQNHATMNHAAGLKCPGDVDAVLMEWETVAQRLPQLFGQISGWLVTEVAADRVRAAAGSSWASSLAAEALAAAAVRQHLTEACIHVQGLREALHDARQITAVLEPAPSEENE